MAFHRITSLRLRRTLAQPTIRPPPVPPKVNQFMSAADDVEQPDRLWVASKNTVTLNAETKSKPLQQVSHCCEGALEGTSPGYCTKHLSRQRPAHLRNCLSRLRQGLHLSQSESMSLDQSNCNRFLISISDKHAKLNFRRGSLCNQSQCFCRGGKSHFMTVLMEWTD